MVIIRCHQDKRVHGRGEEGQYIGKMQNSFNSYAHHSGDADTTGPCQVRASEELVSMLQDMLKYMVIVKPGNGEFTHFCQEYTEGKYAHLDPNIQAARQSRKAIMTPVEPPPPEMAEYNTWLDVKVDRYSEIKSLDSEDDDDDEETEQIIDVFENMEKIERIESIKSIPSPTVLESLISLTKSITKSFNSLIRTQSSSDEVAGNLVMSTEDLIKKESAQVFDQSIHDSRASEASIREMENMIKQISTDVLTSVAKKASQELVYEPDTGFTEDNALRRPSDQAISGPASKTKRIMDVEHTEMEPTRNDSLTEAKNLAQRMSSKLFSDDSPPPRPASVTRLRSEAKVKKSLTNTTQERSDRKTLQREADSIRSKENVARVASYIEQRDENIREIRRSLELLHHFSGTNIAAPDTNAETADDHVTNVSVTSVNNVPKKDPSDLETSSVHNSMDRLDSNNNIIPEQASSIPIVKETAKREIITTPTTIHQPKQTVATAEELKQMTDIEKLRAMRVREELETKVENHEEADIEQIQSSTSLRSEDPVSRRSSIAEAVHVQRLRRGSASPSPSRRLSKASSRASITEIKAKDSSSRHHVEELDIVRQQSSTTTTSPVQLARHRSSSSHRLSRSASRDSKKSNDKLNISRRNSPSPSPVFSRNGSPRVSRNSSRHESLATTTMQIATRSETSSLQSSSLVSSNKSPQSRSAKSEVKQRTSRPVSAKTSKQRMRDITPEPVPEPATCDEVDDIEAQNDKLSKQYSDPEEGIPEGVTMTAKTSETLTTDKTSHTSGASAAKSKRKESSAIKEVPPKGQSQIKTVPMTKRSSKLNQPAKEKSTPPEVNRKQSKTLSQNDVNIVPKGYEYSSIESLITPTQSVHSADSDLVDNAKIPLVALNDDVRCSIGQEMRLTRNEGPRMTTILNAAIDDLSEISIRSGLVEEEEDEEDIERKRLSSTTKKEFAKVQTKVSNKSLSKSDKIVTSTPKKLLQSKLSKTSLKKSLSQSSSILSSKSTLFDAESLLSDGSLIDDESFGESHGSAKQQTIDCICKVSVPSLPTEFPEDKAGTEIDDLEVINYHHYSDSDLTDVMFGQKVMTEIASRQVSETSNKRNSSTKVTKSFSSKKVQKNIPKKPSQTNNMWSTRTSMLSVDSLQSVPSIGSSNDYNLYTFNPNVRSVFDRECLPSDVATQTSIMSNIKSALFGSPAHSWIVDKKRCDTPRHPINAESTQSSLTSVRQLVRSPNISFSDLRSAMTGSMLSWRSWPGPRWYVKDASKHKLSTKVSFSDVDIVRLSTSSSVARDLVVPSKSHEIDLIECEDEDSDNNELENVPPPRSSVPALVVTLLSISIGLSLAYVKIRRMQKLK